MLPQIKEKDSVKDDSIETILPGVLRKMDDTNNTIKEVQNILMLHQRTAFIKYIKKIVGTIVDKVICNKLKKLQYTLVILMRMSHMLEKNITQSYY